MPIFSYKAKNAAGETVKGEREAADKYGLYALLKEDGLETLSVEEKKSGILHMSFGKGGKVNMQERINFARNLGAMLKAGLAVSRALAVIERQTKNKNLQKIVHSLEDSVAKGQTLSPGDVGLQGKSFRISSCRWSRRARNQARWPHPCRSSRSRWRIPMPSNGAYEARSCIRR